MISFRLTLDTGGWGNTDAAGRAGDWWAQAVKDLEQAQESHHGGRHEWACFAAQQAAEKGVKALYLHFGQEGAGNLVSRLIADAPGLVTMDPNTLEWARVLDTYYLAARYPDCHAEGAPFQRYGPLQSDEAVLYSRKILEFVYQEVGGVSGDEDRRHVGLMLDPTE